MGYMYQYLAVMKYYMIYEFIVVASRSRPMTVFITCETLDYELVPLISVPDVRERSGGE
jgi:hypothetical protein